MPLSVQSCLALLLAVSADGITPAWAQDSPTSLSQAVVWMVAQQLADAFDDERLIAAIDQEGATQEVLEWTPGSVTGQIRRDHGWQPAGAAVLTQALGSELLQSARPGMKGLWLNPMVWLDCRQTCTAFRLDESQWAGAVLQNERMNQLPVVVVLKDAEQQPRRTLPGPTDGAALITATPVFAEQQLLGPHGWNWHVELYSEQGSSDASSLTGPLLGTLAVVILLIGTAGYLVALSRRDRRRAEEQIRFVASATHELRTPLSVIDGAADSLAEGIVTETTAVAEYGGLIRTESRRLASLINNVLQFSSANQRLDHIDPVDISEWIQAAIAMAAGDPDRISVEIREPLPIIRANRAALDSLLVNLLNNAIRYSEDQTAVIRAQAITRAGGQLALAVSVVNRVAGRIDADAEQWFEPFRRGRTGRPHQGTGLGLSVARTIARQHGGDISLRVEDQTVRLTVFLPEATSA